LEKVREKDQKTVDFYTPDCYTNQAVAENGDSGGGGKAPKKGKKPREAP